MLFASIFFLCGWVQAQTTVTERAIYRLFDKPGKVVWLKHYKGRFDGVNHISVSLAYDGKDCKGQMTYLSSHEKFLLEGEIDGKELNLAEKDQKGNVSAIILGSISGKNIEADWMTVENNTGAKIFLEEVNREVKIAPRCGNDKWIRVYHGFLQKEKVELVLHHPDPADFYGIVFFKNQKTSYKVNGEKTADDKIELVLKDADNTTKGVLNSVFDNRKTLKGKFLNEADHAEPISLALVDELDIECIEHADFQSNIDISYPNTLNEKFNGWMENFAQKWVKNSNRQIKKLKPQFQKIKPEHRAILRAFGWCDISMVNERLITGIFSSSYSWAGIQPETAFNFDLFSGKLVQEEDIFIANSAYAKFVDNYIKQMIARFSLNREKAFRAWIKNETFSNFVIQKDGIRFSSSFSPLYGRQEVVVPYKILKPFLIENSAVWHLARTANEEE